MSISRRGFVAAGAFGALTGCTSGGGRSAPSTSGATGAVSGSAAPSGTGPTSASASGSPSAGGAAALPAVTAWTPSPNDIRPAVKLRAVRLIEALGNWTSANADARARATRAGYDPALVAQAGSLLPAAAASALQVLEAQYGGILSDSASVLVVCRQRTPAGPTGGITVDVRLTRSQPVWTVTALHPSQPGSASGSLSSAARAVLASDAIALPPAGHADIAAGQVHDTALDALLALSRRYRIELSVVRSGHPINVFGTTRPSDHPRGRAFDVWRIDGHAVVDPATSHSLVDGFMRAAAATGSYNVGGPRLLSGGTGNQFFSDDTHHDHVHVGFTG